MELSRVTSDRVHLLLPPASYHVTIMGLWVRKGFPSAVAYNQHNQDNKAKLAELDALLAKAPILRMRADTTESHKLYNVQLSPADQEATTVLYHQQNCVKTAYPALPLSHPHMTLAYRRNNRAQLTAAEEERVISVMKTLPPVLSFSAPRVCAFIDMLNFVPIFNVKNA